MSEHQQMIFEAWDNGQAIEARHIKDDRWIDVPVKGSPEANEYVEDPDHLNWEYRLKAEGGS